jgi:hypothetical protein
MAAIRRAGAEGAGEVQHYAGLMRQDARKKMSSDPALVDELVILLPGFFRN